MRQPKQTTRGRVSPAEQAMRDEEVVRANRELAAYFKGRRTEREARAALKIIKAFVRERERVDPAARPPLPGLAAPARHKTPARRPKSQKSKHRKPIDNHARIDGAAVRGDGVVSDAM